MKQGQIVAVFNIIKRFQENNELPNDISYAFFRIGKIIQDQVDFQVDRQNQILSKYKYSQGDNGALVFDNPEDVIAFNKELDEVLALDVELGEYKKVPFKIDGRINLSVHDLIVLEDFVEYV